MPANVDGMVREGISAYRAGRKDEARTLLLRAVEIDQYNEQAWLWLSAVVESVDEQRTCLENVLTINPNNERAKQGLQTLSQKAAPAASAKAISTAAEDVLASTSFTPTPSSKIASDPFNTNEEEELPASIEWEAPSPPPPTATSSASSSYRVNEPSPEEYDAWVNNLNLGNNAMADDGTQSSTLDAAAQFMSTPFDDDDDLFKVGTQTADDDLDLFSSGPFSAPETSLPVTKTPPPIKTPPASSNVRNSPLSTSPGDSLLDEIDEVNELGSTFDQEFDRSEFDKLDASEFFQYIPKGIQATRLPGTRERYPALAILGLLAVCLLNIGAVALFIMNLTAK